MENTDNNNKRFEEWAAFSRRLHEGKHKRGFQEGEIWWVAVGENIGVEINGKSDVFSRPVLIIKKLGQLGFIGVPLTSKEKDSGWYMPFKFNNGDSEAALTQTRPFSVYRLLGRMGKVTMTDLDFVKEAYRSIFR